MGNTLAQGEGGKGAKDRALAPSGRVTVTPKNSATSKWHRRKRDVSVGAVYDLEEALGVSALSFALCVRHKATKTLGVCRAVTKQATLTAARKTSNSTYVHREADIMEHLAGPLIMELVEVYEDEAMYQLILELPPGGRLLDQALLSLSPSEAQTSEVVEMAARCVHHCHRRGVIHRSICPQSFLITGLPSDAPSTSGPLYEARGSPRHSAFPGFEAGAAPAAGSREGSGSGCRAAAAPQHDSGPVSSVNSTPRQSPDMNGAVPGGGGWAMPGTAGPRAASPASPTRCSGQVLITGLEPEEGSGRGESAAGGAAAGKQQQQQQQQQSHSNGHATAWPNPLLSTAGNIVNASAAEALPPSLVKPGQAWLNTDNHQQDRGGAVAATAPSTSTASTSTRLNSNSKVNRLWCGLTEAFRKGDKPLAGSGGRAGHGCSSSGAPGVGLGGQGTSTSLGLRLVGFEEARFVTKGSHFASLRGSFLHAAPEMVRKHLSPSDPSVPGYGPEVDVWALGVMLYCMLTGRMPFMEETQSATLQSILNDPLDLSSEPWPRISEHAKSLVRAMLDKNPRTRITARQVMQHPFATERRSLSTAPTYRGVSELWTASQALKQCRKEAHRFSARIMGFAEAQKLLAASEVVQRSGNGAVKQVEGLLASLLHGSFALRTPQLVELTQILTAVEVQLESLRDLLQFLSALLQLMSSMPDELLCTILSNLEPGKRSASVTPGDVMRVLGASGASSSKAQQQQGASSRTPTPRISPEASTGSTGSSGTGSSGTGAAPSAALQPGTPRGSAGGGARALQLAAVPSPRYSRDSSRREQEREQPAHEAHQGRLLSTMPSLGLRYARESSKREHSTSPGQSQKLPAVIAVGGGGSHSHHGKLGATHSSPAFFVVQPPGLVQRPEDSELGAQRGVAYLTQ